MTNFIVSIFVSKTEGLFTNSIDSTDFSNKITAAFSTQQQLSNLLSEENSEIFDYYSAREVIERLTRGQSLNPVWFKYRQ